MVFMPGLVLAIAQGFAADADKFDQAVHYARIAFPYLFFISLLSLFAGVLNATGRFSGCCFCAGLAQSRFDRGRAFIADDIGRTARLSDLGE